VVARHAPRSGGKWTAGRLQCISYAPSADPGADPRGVTLEKIRADLALLARRTGCVRTYTVSGGFDRVPEVAAEFGLQVLLGRGSPGMRHTTTARSSA